MSYASDALIDALERQVKKTKAENDKLREYIDLKETCWKYVGWCDECPYNGADNEYNDFNCTMQKKINWLACELGIKVDK